MADWDREINDAGAYMGMFILSSIFAVVGLIVMGGIALLITDDVIIAGIAGAVGAIFGFYTMMKNLQKNKMKNEEDA